MKSILVLYPLAIMFMKYWDIYVYMQNVLEHEFQGFYGMGYDSNTALENLGPNGNNRQNLLKFFIVLHNKYKCLIFFYIFTMLFREVETRIIALFLQQQRLLEFSCWLHNLTEVEKTNREGREKGK